MLGDMVDLWYPGRPPFCSQQLIKYLDEIIDILAFTISDQSGERLPNLEAICSAAVTLIADENADYLDTDESLNGLYSLFEDTYRGALLFYRGQAWEQLMSLATHLGVAQNYLINALEGATDDGRSIQTESNG